MSKAIQTTDHLFFCNRAAINNIGLEKHCQSLLVTPKITEIRGDNNKHPGVNDQLHAEQEGSHLINCNIVLVHIVKWND